MATIETYRDVPIELDGRTRKCQFALNRKVWAGGTLKSIRKEIDRIYKEDVFHNGANTNLWCDGVSTFVTGCPACDLAHKAIMKPQWGRAKTLSSELVAAGMANVQYHADLWKIWAEGLLNNRMVRVEEK